ncbi:MAG: DMT family transporter [Chloroflexota bacterium]|nr:DMT family transporter [Chloroflexota bacterium]
MKRDFRPVVAAALTPILLGVAPIFGKLAITAGVEPFGVAAVRTLIAVVFLWVLYLLFFPRYIFIYPAGLLGCMVVGFVNGMGSLFYYGGLGLLDASLAQMLNGSYILFALLLSRIGGEPIDRRVLLRIACVLAALVMLTGFGSSTPNWLGVGLMLANALMFAGTMILSQYVVYEMPSPTVALYVLTTMALLVAMVWGAVGQPIPSDVLFTALPSMLALGITTALSRLALFASVGFLGSLRTTVIAISEMGFALLVAFVILGDRLTPIQVGGVIVLMVSLGVLRTSDSKPARSFNPNTLLLRDVSSAQFQRIAFHRAFGKAEHDNEAGVMGNLTTVEMLAIQRMMGASNKPVDPFPIGRGRSIPAVDFNTLLDSQEITRAHRPKKDEGDGAEKRNAKD